MIVYACSSNRAKLEEILLAGRQSGLTHLTVQSFPGLKQILPPDETGSTFEENASSKAAYYSAFVEGLVLADDSGLEVAALGGAPGIYSARYSGPNATDADNNRLLLQRLEHQENRAARFVCAVALARANQVLTTVQGIADGEIVTYPRGDQGFGYDPLFFYPPLSRTFAELNPKEKLAVSHRGKALRELFACLSYAVNTDTASSDKIG